MPTGARLVFPEDRTAFIYQQPGKPILTPYRTGIQLFQDQAATQLADIQTLVGQTISNSAIYTGDDALLPEFLGPDNYVDHLWGKVIGGNANTYPVVAQYNEQLALIPVLLNGTGAPANSVGAFGSFYLDDADPTHPVLYGPKGLTWPTPGVPLIGPPGPAGGSYEHNQASPAMNWVVDHPLTYRPNVTVLDSSGAVVFGDVSYPSATRVVISFSAAFGGKALLS